MVSSWLNDSPHRPLLVIVGPTASGKTEFAIRLAEIFEGEIVNADSRQIYRELEIGSAPPTAAEQAEIPHHLVGIASPAEKISVAQYRKLAETKIQKIWRRGKLPILAGGHTLLISAIIENFQFPGKVDEKRRAELGEIWEKNPEKLWKMLQKLDSKTAAKIPKENRHHLIRTVERAELGNEGKKGERKFDTLILGLNPDRKKLYARIDQRVDKMLKSGLLAEVESLSEKYDRYAPAMRGHGYREILDFLAREKNWETTVEEIRKDTRNYAKRQMTWWRNCGFAKEIIWL